MADLGRDFSDIPEDEPGFHIRGQDIGAAATVRFYADLVERKGASPRLVAKARAHADVIEAYQALHGSKLPDL